MSTDFVDESPSVWRRLGETQAVWILAVLVVIVAFFAIARAIAWASKVVFLDEPTAALGVVQTRNVLDSIKRVRDRGIAVVFISHSMPEVLQIADRIQVMRLGKRVATYRSGETNVEQLVGAMTGALDFKSESAA